VFCWQSYNEFENKSRCDGIAFRPFELQMSLGNPMMPD
jgi:hypothetical protein